MHIEYAIVFVSDMSKAVAYYRDVLGLPLRFESPGWTEFASEGATLALHASELTDREEPPGSVRIGFNLPDLDAFHERMLANDVQCLQEPKVQFGAKLAQYVGPDGMVFSVGESAKT